MTTEEAIKYLSLYIKINDKRAIPLTKEELKFKLEEDFTQKVSEAINLLLEDSTRLDKENQKLFEENLFKDKVIDRMIETISDEFGNGTYEDRKEWKEFYYKKVEDDEKL